MRRAAVALGSALALSGCAPSAGSPPAREQARPASSAQQPAPSTPRSASAGAAATSADAAVAEALALVAQVRQLPSKRQVPGVRLGRQALRAEVEQMLADEAPAELVAGNTEFLFALDTVPASFDLKAAIAVLYGAELAGFYDPDRERMVLATDLGEEAERMTLYHELVHALQDQHYDLGAGLDWKPGETDRLAALHALGEGDATRAMIDVFAHAAGVAAPEIPADLLRMDTLRLESAPELAAVPPVVTRSLVAPYADGLGFVNALRERAPGWSAVDSAWRERPSSTEQILHPEKYFAREPALPLPPIAAPAGFGKAIFDDVVGEQGLRILFEEWMPARRAAEAASDWGGDRFSVFSAAERRTVHWHLAFDTEAAARRAVLALARGAIRDELPAAPAGPTPIVRELSTVEAAQQRTRSGRLCQDRPQRGPFAVARHGRHVGVVLGPYERATTGVRGAGTCPQAQALADALAKQL